MVQTPGGILEAGGDFLWLQVRILLQDLLRRLARGQQLQDVTDPDAHAADAGTAAALLRINVIRSNKLDIASSVLSFTSYSIALHRSEDSASASSAKRRNPKARKEVLTS
jgi:hypothetical protein